MQDLRLIGVHEDGRHLLLAGEDGVRFTVPLDDALRAAARRDRPRLGQLQIEMDTGMRPREVQALIRSGSSAQEVAERSGWPVEKIRKYEGPILAERAYVAELARQVRMRTRGGSTGSDVPTLTSRVAQRMRARGVDPSTNEWDAWRSADEGRWTLVLNFVAGGRERQASWTFDPASRTVDATDDEARWLSEEEDPSSKGPLARAGVASPRTSAVYDVEAEGGLGSAGPGTRGPARDEPVDLMTAMRERSTVRGRRSTGRRKPAPTELPGADSLPVDALPLAELTYDPVADGPPPPAHRHPEDEADAIAEGPEQDRPRSTTARKAPARTAAAGRKPSAPVADDPQADRAEAARRGNRASVPSWDDIMFGARRD